MKRNLKVTISALAVLLVMALTVTVISFSLAGNENDNILTVASGDISGSVSSNTNIDNIIENSFRTDDENLAIYKVVEIGSGSPSSLKKMVEDGDFVEFVINGNKTIEFVNTTTASATDATVEAIMKADKISYEFFSASAVTDENTEALAKISNADFIYISNDAASPYSTSNDLCEELYNLLHTYAVGDYKPLVIDNIGDSSGSGGGSGAGSSDYTMPNLVTKVFDKSGKYYYTFKWTDGQSASDFVNHVSPSMYLGINGGKKSANWIEVTADAGTPTDSTNKKKMAEVLVVNNGTTTMANNLLSDVLATTPKTGLVDMTGTPVTGDVYDIANTLLYNKGYNSRYARPDYARVTKVDIDDIATYDLVKYDLVIIEADCNVEVTKDVYNKFAAAMYGSVQIVYPSGMVTSSGNSGNGNTSTDSPVLNITNYSELFYMVATTDAMPKYVNIMVTNKAEFDVIATSKSAATCKVIADLINASAFRGIGGPGSSGNMYTVLEIQPCYPIDEALAMEIGQKIPRDSRYTGVFGTGNYYTKPSDVVNGKTKEQIDEGTEYYAWELSKAKIAEVTGLSVNQINLVQMSSEELASSKVEILGTYDLIYVGANNSALKDAGQYRSLVNLLGWGGTIGYENGNPRVSADNLKKLPIYTTYSHSGDFVRTTVVTYGSLVNGQKSAARANINNTVRDSSFAVLNGNDITYNNLQALNEYVNAGMPVVFNTEATAAYNDAKTNGYLQNSLDPDSNMFKFMDACMTKSTGTNTVAGAKNILWDFDNTKEIRTDNDGGTLGETQVGYVKVFAGSIDDPNTTTVESSGITTDVIDSTVVTGDRAKLVKLLADSNIRPKITVTASPAIYNMYDESTKLTNKTLTYEYKVNASSKYTVNLYIDDDGNSLFSSGEKVATGGNDKLTFTVASSFYGPLYWKLEVVDALGMETNITGISYIKNMTTAKQKIRVLQIMPSGSLVETNDPARDPNTLFFCTICQQTYHRLDYNPSSDAGDRASYSALYSGRYTDTDNGMDRAGAGVYMGRHEHRFGIVQYDSTMELPAGTTQQILQYGNTGMDDWDTNLADEVSDLYEFDLDIMNRKEFEATAEAVRKAYDFSGMTDAQKDAKINAFVISTSDSEYKTYSAMTDKDEKLKFITMRENAELASSYHAQYLAQVNNKTPEPEAALVEKLKLIKANYGNPAAGRSSFGSGWGQAYIDSEIDRMIELKTYWDFFSMCNFEALSNDVSLAYLGGESIRPYYNAYVLAKDKEIEYLEQYKYYDRLANPDNWLLGCYNAVIIGPSDDFAGDDITNAYALADLADYIDNNGTLLLFHDTLSKFSDAGSVTLTSTLRDDFGMDRYHMSVDTTKQNLENSSYVPYLSTDSDKYFMSNLSTKASDDATRYTGWTEEMHNVFTNYSGTRYLTNVAFTDAVAISDQNGNDMAMPYKYADMAWATFVNWNRDAQMTEKSQTKFGTNRASQNNKGIITLFPFTLSDELNIAGTHSQVYALDIESDDMTVWYSLAAGTNTKDGSSIFAASPRDGMDNYFIYSYGSVYYCGAGHSKVTGIGKDNNDERRLYINIICNSVRKSVMQPDIFVYDYNTTENNKFKKSGDNYIVKVDTMEEYPEFSFLARLDEDAKISTVRIYYDLDYLDKVEDEYVADDKHVLIANWTREHVVEGMLKNVWRYDATIGPLLGDDGKEIPETYVDENGNTISTRASLLKLLPKYFDPYNGQYTYIVIEVTDTEGNISYKRIKIQLKDKLFNLT